MAISADLIVRIVPQVVTATGTALRPNGLIITDSVLYPALSVTQWTNASLVADAYGATSLEAVLAAIYFKGYRNSPTKPRVLYIGSAVRDELAAWVNGGKMQGTPAELAALKAITAGTMQLTVGGAAADITVDLSTAASFTGVAELIQAELREATGDEFAAAEVSYSSQTKSYRITAGLGAAALIGYPTGSLADALRLTQATAAMLSQGQDALPFADNMTAFLKNVRNFVQFMTTWEPDQAGKLDIAKWTSDNAPPLYLCGMGYRYHRHHGQ